ncbi:glycoside hydrolase family 88 protein [Paenibacillus qinlingensis]|uniref:glycoside hydrolase family 88 protein n=1 Tax=Paenibacillus qinlingensis TaxID=1837343 RepID=UPI0015638C39|nr:glycoside hydrolase family 88 protein [Paenibacillus qinlingensis]NQX63669.1 glycoside hydrolase family 88 protein [Paenibacillus qinlingensis]
MNTIIRSDFTAYHTFVIDPVTGEPMFGQTHQGYADESVWSRGQTWAIAGYTHAYRYTGNEEYLNVARNCAKVFLDSVEADLIPIWDFSVPDPETAKRDSSAAAIAAASLLELAKFVDGSERAAYETYANQVVQNLFEIYSTNHDETHEGLLIHGCGHHPAGKNIDCSLIYGDYYFVEAVARLLGKTKVYW